MDNQKVILEIVEMLDFLDERITRIEDSLEKLQVDDHYFSGWGSYHKTIEEIKRLINIEIKECEYCNGKWNDKKPLMKNGKGDYLVKINECNYLEDSEVGDWNFKYSLFGEQINYCPMCGRKLGKK